MTTGTDTDLLGQLAESVERAASLLAAGSRLAGPAAAQDDAADLVPGDEGAGVCLTFADGSVLTVFLVPALAAELCGGTDPGQITAGLQVVTDEVAGGRDVELVDVAVLSAPAALVAALEGRPTILGAGIFDGDDVAATIGAAPAIPGAPLPATADTPPVVDDAPDADPSIVAPADPTPAADPMPNIAAMPAMAGGGTGRNVSVDGTTLARGLAMLADVHLEITAELGRCHLTVSELLDLEPGSVIGLERAAGSPVDLKVNGSLFARAEVIVQDGSYAVRIVELTGNGTVV